jgi:hypothetical protein
MGELEMTFLSYLLTGFLLLLLIGFILGAFLLVKSWKDAPERARKEYQNEVNGHAFTLLLLLVLAIAPPIIAALRGIGLYPTASVFGGSLLWAGLVIWFWDKRAVPIEARELSPSYPDSNLQPPYKPNLPGPIIKPGLPLNPVPIPPLQDDHLIHNTYHWIYHGKDEIPQTIEMDISLERYEQSRSEGRMLDVKEWHRYVTEDMPEVRVLAAHFQNLHLQREWSTFEQASNVLSFVQQCVKYSYDQDTTPLAEWPRYPIETLMEETGDCEDMAILTAAVLARLGFQVVLLEYPEHIALGIAGAEGLPGTYIKDPVSKRFYFYAEATAQGAHIGEIPETFRGKPPLRIIPVDILIKRESLHTRESVA